MRFRSHPEVQIPTLRAACFFPELERQAGDSISVCSNFGWAVLIHGKVLTYFNYVSYCFSRIYYLILAAMAQKVSAEPELLPPRKIRVRRPRKKRTPAPTLG